MRWRLKLNVSSCSLHSIYQNQILARLETSGPQELILIGILFNWAKDGLNCTVGKHIDFDTIFQFIYSFYNPTSPSFKPHLTQFSLPFPLPLHLWERRGTHKYHPTLAQQVSVGLDLSWPTEARQGTRSQQAKDSGTTLIPAVGGPAWRPNWLHFCYICAGPLGLTLVDGSVSGIPARVQVSRLCWPSCGIPTLLGIFNPSSSSPTSHP